jgi:hypothetical protein
MKKLSLFFALILVTGVVYAQTPDEMVKQGYALTYDFDGDINIYTNKGNYFRQDSGIGAAHNAYIFVKGTGADRRDDLYHEDEGVWYTEKFRAEQTINGFFSSFIADNHEIYEKNGYAKTGTTTICGKVCDVYSGTYTGEGRLAIYGSLGRKGAKGEIAVWNGFTLRVKYYDDVLWECTNIKVGIPDSAFEKSLDSSWAK